MISIEQKAKAYERAVKEASIAYKDEDRHLKATLERIFPELKESTDKFKVGDWIIHNDNNHIPLKIIEKIGMFYRIVDTVNYHHNILIDCINENYHLWTIQDAKAGDVLVRRHDKRPFIFKGFLDELHPNYPVAYCGMCAGESFQINTDNGWWTCDTVFPATEEQRNLLFKKMREAGYEWDREKKELRKIDWNPQPGDTFRKKGTESPIYYQNLTVTDEELAQAKKDAYNNALDKIEYHNGEPTFDDGWSAAIWYLKKRNLHELNLL